MAAETYVLKASKQKKSDFSLSFMSSLRVERETQEKIIYFDLKLIKCGIKIHRFEYYDIVTKRCRTKHATHSIYMIKFHCMTNNSAQRKSTIAVIHDNSAVTA